MPISWDRSRRPPIADAASVAPSTAEVAGPARGVAGPAHAAEPRRPAAPVVDGDQREGREEQDAEEGAGPRAVVHRSVAGFGNEDLAQRLEILDTLARAEDDGVERVIDHVDRHA